MWDMGITGRGHKRAIRSKAFRFKRNECEKEVLATLSCIRSFPVNPILLRRIFAFGAQNLWTIGDRRLTS